MLYYTILYITHIQWTRDHTKHDLSKTWIECDGTNETFDYKTNSMYRSELAEHIDVQKHFTCYLTYLIVFEYQQ